MTTLEIYNRAFSSAFCVEEDKLANLSYRGMDSWDSVGHMSLIALLEESFEILMDTDDIIGLSSYEKGKEILNKYGIEM